MFGSLLGSLGDVLQLQYLIPLGIGTLAGLIGGALPGVTITMTIIIVLPFTFGLDPLAGLAAMVGVYVGGESGGLVTASLIGIPGTPSAVTRESVVLTVALWARLSRDWSRELISCWRITTYDVAASMATVTPRTSVVSTATREAAA